MTNSWLDSITCSYCCRVIPSGEVYSVFNGKKICCYLCKQKKKTMSNSIYTTQTIDFVEWKFRTQDVRLYLPLRMYGTLTFKCWDIPLRYAIDDMSQTWCDDGNFGPLQLIPPVELINTLVESDVFKVPPAPIDILDAYYLISRAPVRYTTGSIVYLGESVSSKDLPRESDIIWSPDLYKNEIVTIQDAPWRPRTTHAIVNFKHMKNKTMLEVRAINNGMRTPSYM